MRCIYTGRDLWMRHILREKRPINETYVYEKRRINQTYLRAKRPINEMHLYRQRPVNETYLTWKETYQWDVCIRTETCKQNPMCAHERETCNTRRVTRVLASEQNPFMCAHNPMCAQNPLARTRCVSLLSRTAVTHGVFKTVFINKVHP